MSQVRYRYTAFGNGFFLEGIISRYNDENEASRIMFSQSNPFALGLLTGVLGVLVAYNLILALVLKIWNDERKRSEAAVQAGRQLAEDEARLNQRRLSSLLAISQHRASSMQELLDDALEEAIALSDSQVGYIYHDRESEQLFTLHAWPKAEADAPGLPDPKMGYTLEQMGVWGEAIRQRRPIVINDFQAAHPSNDEDQDGQAHLLRYMAIPVFSEGKIVAVTGVANKASDYTEQDVHQLTLMMEMVWKIVERRQAEQEAQQRTAELELLTHFSAAMRVAQTRAEIYTVLLKQLAEQFSAEGAFIALRDDGDDHLVIELGILRWALYSGLRIPAAEGITGEVIAGGRPYCTNDILHDPVATRPEDFSGLMAVACIPLLVNQNVIGVLWFGRTAPISDNDMRMLVAIGNMVANAINRQTLYENLQIQVEALNTAQAHLMESEKLAAVGQLVAGVAHELNSPLTSILLYTQLMEMKALSGEEEAAGLKNIANDAQRAAKIVRGLLDFARQRPAERRTVSINDLLKASLELVAYELRSHNIQWEIQLSPDVPMTLADPQQLQQVFINLINNAWQAMNEAHGTGHLLVTTALRRSRFSGSQPDAPLMIQVAFRDDGPGIPPDLTTHIFDPFFTTKPEGKGTGLGLSICHGIIAEHDGHIWAENNRAGGATFYIDLPILGSTYSVDEIAPAQVRNGGEHPAARILIVDDEASVLNGMSRVLRHNGYQVESVADGKSAMERINAAPFDLILCDMRLPDMGGEDLYWQLYARDPGLAKKIIFTTGDVINTNTRRMLEETHAPYLTKPFAVEQLLAKIDQAFSQRDRLQGRTIG